jgi:hypothetical protein
MIIMLSTIVIFKTGTSSAIGVPDNEYYRISQMPETRYYDHYESLSMPEKTAVVYPILTQTAYSWGGIHDFFTGYCKTCNIVKIDDSYDPIFSVGAKSFRILEFLGYDVIDDIDIDKDPEILKKYDSIVLLHNEFVTQKEFSAIRSHPNVIYLYPGTFISKVKIDYTNDLMILERGPSYPHSGIKNGFDWEFDNSFISNDLTCGDWDFYKIDNGYMLNCTPEYLIEDNYELLRELKQLVEL